MPCPGWLGTGQSITPSRSAAQKSHPNLGDGQLETSSPSFCVGSRPLPMMFSQSLRPRPFATPHQLALQSTLTYALINHSHSFYVCTAWSSLPVKGVRGSGSSFTIWLFLWSRACGDARGRAGLVCTPMILAKKTPCFVCSALTSLSIHSASRPFLCPFMYINNTDSS